MASFLGWKSSFSVTTAISSSKTHLKFDRRSQYVALCDFTGNSILRSCDPLYISPTIPWTLENVRVWILRVVAVIVSETELAFSTCLLREGGKEGIGREGGKEGWRRFGQMHWNGIHDILISSSLRFSLFFKIKLKSKITYWMTCTHDTLAQLLVNDA